MEEDWVRYGVSGRRKRNVKRMADLRALRQGRREQLRVAGQVNLTVSEAEGGGTRVIDAKGISKSFGDRLIVGNFSVRIHRGNRVGVVGANGAGKTTLLNMLIGKLPPNMKLKLVAPGMPGQPMYYAVPAKAAQQKLAEEFVALATSPEVQAEGIVKKFNWYPGIDAQNLEGKLHKVLVAHAGLIKPREMRLVGAELRVH